MHHEQLTTSADDLTQLDKFWPKWTNLQMHHQQNLSLVKPGWNHLNKQNCDYFVIKAFNGINLTTGLFLARVAKLDLNEFDDFHHSQCGCNRWDKNCQDKICPQGQLQFCLLVQISPNWYYCFQILSSILSDWLPLSECLKNIPVYIPKLRFSN